MHNSSTKGQYLRIGSLLCEVHSEPPHYANTLAYAYGAPLMQQIPSDESEIELVLRIREKPTSIAHLSDALTVTATHNGHRIDTDPISCTLTHTDLGSGKRRTYVDIDIRQPSMDITPLGYHLWLVINRMLLLLDSLLIHTAAIELNNTVNLFCGHKGAGKSTLSVFLGQSGGNILAEDHVILRRKQSSYHVSGCTSRMRITAATEAFLLPDKLLHEAVQIGDMPKKEFPAETFFSAKPHQERKPQRLFLNYVGQSFGVRPLSTKEALLNIVDRTANMYRFSDQKDYASFFSFLAGFVTQVECYSLELSPDLSKLPQVLEMLNELDSKSLQGENA